ncbi:MAG: metal-dependent hydrolase [Candidatus Shikimatogenerans bostrichidophilus]|nr:MAG: metal-dependent hydrolase [Candidatus Shikimatogenerans bostrichidophilus]
MIKIKYISHSTILLIINNIYLLVDPFFTNNPILKNKNIRNFNKIDYILITHAHIDHTKDVCNIYNIYKPKIISNYEICNYYNKNFQINKYINLNFGSYLKINNDLYIKYVYALHSSSFPDGTYGGSAGGFIIKYKNKYIYISGDTDIFYDMKNFNIKFNLIILPIGGIYTMDYKTAYLASNLLKSYNIMGVHYNTFIEIKINKKKILNYFKNKGKNINLLKEYEKIII